MKFLVYLTLTLLLLIAAWMAYDYTTWEDYPISDVFPLYTEVSDQRYISRIDRAEERLIQIREELQVPSVSIAVSRDGTMLWSAATGYAHMDKAAALATPKSVYRIGSISKPLTATVAARLYDRRQLDLDKKIGHHIDNYPQKKWDFNLRQLLSHTAGIGNYEDFGPYGLFISLCNCTRFSTVSESLDVFNEVDLLYRPGTEYKYSTFDNSLVAAWMEQRTRKTFLDLVAEEIFTPLNMRDTYADHAPGRENPKSLVTFYERKAGTFREYRTLGLINHDIDLSYKWAGGGFLSTPSDLVRLGNAWLSDSTYLSQETKATFWAPQPLENGEENGDQYALGWRSEYAYQDSLLLEGKKVWLVHHSGSTKGAMNLLFLFPEYKMSMDVAINAQATSMKEFWESVLSIADLFLKEEPEV